MAHAGFDVAPLTRRARCTVLFDETKPRMRLERETYCLALLELISVLECTLHGRPPLDEDQCRRFRLVFQFLGHRAEVNLNLNLLEHAEAKFNRVVTFTERAVLPGPALSRPGPSPDHKLPRT